MRKGVQWCGLVLGILLAAGCGTKNDRAADRVESVDDAGMKAKSDSGVDAADEDPGMGGRILSERETQDGTRQGMSVRIYHSNAAAQVLCVNTVRVEEVTPEVLVWNLASYGMLPDSVEVEKMQTKKDGEALLLDLDLSEEFELWFTVLDETSREFAVGSLVNTFLDAYEGAKIRITSDGKNMSEGYEERYPYQEASYTLEWAEYTAEGIQIRYPQLKGVANQELEEQWNQRIRERVQETAEQVTPGTAYEESCTVETMNDEVLSLLMEGKYQSAEMPYPSVSRCTYNIDMVSGVNIRLAHYQDVEQLAENLFEGVGYTVQGITMEDFLSRLSILYSDVEQLASSLKGYDFGRDEDIPTGYSYQEGGRTHLCMEVPHALGDYMDLVLEEE